MSRRCRRAVLGEVGVITWMVVVAAIAAIGPAAAQQAASPVDLRIAWWGSQDRHNRTIKTIELFQKKHPHIKVSYEFAGWSDYWTKMTTQAAGRNLPDVMQQDYAYIAEWSSRGLLAPLDDHVKNGTIDTRNVSEALLKGGVVGSKLVAINLGSNSQCWVVDLDAFQERGPRAAHADVDVERLREDRARVAGEARHLGHGIRSLGRAAVGLALSLGRAAALQRRRLPDRLQRRQALRGLSRHAVYP